METTFSKRTLSPEERRELADRTVEMTVAESDSQRHDRHEKTARLRELRLAQLNGTEATDYPWGRCPRVCARRWRQSRSGD